jgi:polar amino acid transport system substrate-binding protein
MRYTQLIRGSTLAVVMALLMMPLTVSAQTLERIKSSGTFNIGFVPDQPPFSSKAETGQPTGYSIELCQKVADAAKDKPGLSGLKVKYTPTTIKAGLDMVANGEVDILCGAVTDTLQRREQVSFSIPVFNGGIGALVRKDAPPDLLRVLKGEVAHTGPIWRSTINRGLSQHTYAVDTGTTTEQWVRDKIATLGVIATVVDVDNHEKGVQMVADGKADAYFADRVILEDYFNREKGDHQLMVLERYFNYEPIALAVARTDEDFRLLVDTTLSGLYYSDDFVGLYTRFFGKPSDVTQMLFKAYARH